MGTKMGISRMSPMARVAAIITVIVVALVAYVTLNKDEPAKAKPIGPPIQVFPQVGDMTIVSTKDGAVVCNDYDGVPTKAVLLPDSGGTVAYNDTKLSTDYSNDAVVVTIDGKSDFVAGWVTGSNGQFAPFDVPAKARGEDSPGLRLESDDFKAITGAIADITLCSMD